MESQNEVKNFIKVWTTILISLSFYHAVLNKVPQGTKRLVLTLPIVILFLYLPLKLTSINLGVTTSFFVTWLCSFKLLLFSLGKGPLSGPPTSLARFLVVSCLPIEIRQQQQQNPLKKRPKRSALKLPAKLFLLTVLFYVFNHKRSKSHPRLTALLLWPLVFYLLVETIMAGLAGLVRAAFRAEIEPQFDEPYLSTSLEDFWFRRYNLPVSHIMRAAVHDPVFSLWAEFVGRRWAFAPAVMGSFLVNGLVHELIYFYVGRTWPTWEVPWFFIVHGSALTAEICLKEALSGADTWRVPRAVSVALTNGFVVLTTAWLLFPPLLPLGFEARLSGEYRALGVFLKSIAQKLNIYIFKNIE